MSLEFNDKQQEEIDAYLQNTMSMDARISFEKRMQQDLLFKEEVLLYKSLQSSLNENDWNSIKNKNEAFNTIKNRLKSKEYQDISKNIRTVESTYTNTKKGKKFNFYKLGIAASILLLIAISLPSLFNNTLNSYYNAYENWEEIPSSIEKGAQNESQKIESLYALKSYNTLIILYELDSEKDYPDYSLMQIGHAYFQLNKPEKAIKVFDELITLNKLSSSRGYWYKLLIYLKIEDKQNAKLMLGLILQNENNYKYDEALYLSKKIK